MFFSFGAESALETLVALSKPYAPEKQISDVRELKAAYLRFLTNYQPSVGLPSGESTVFVDNAESVEHLAGFFRVKSWLNDKNQGRMIEGQFSDVVKRVKRLESGLVDLEAIAPEFVELFKLTINYVFCASSSLAGGGSTSSALGVIWAAHRDSWSQTDFSEFFVHELSHNLVFLDECRFKHYRDYPSLALRENHVQSAILSIPRPLDKVVHSLLVATEVLLFRERISGHPTAPLLHPRSETLMLKAKQCLDSIDSLSNRKQLMTPRGLELVERAREIILSLPERNQVASHEEVSFKSVPFAI